MNNVETVFEGIIALAAIAAVVLSIYFIVRSIHTEKMALIEKGLYTKDKLHDKPLKERYGILKWGILFVSIGLGLFFGYVISTLTNMDSVISYFVMILFFGGMSLILSYIIVVKIKAKE